MVVVLDIARLGAPTVLVAIVVSIAGVVPIAGADPELRSPPEAAPPTGSLVLTDDPLIVGTHPLTVESWSRPGDRASLLVHFTSPAPACSGVHAITRESEDAVTVELLGGSLRGAVDRMCPMIVVRATLAIPLEDPVGSRRVLTS